MFPQLDPSTDPRTRTSVQDVRALLTFDAAAEAVLAYLSSTFDLALWMVTRTAGDDWVVLRATDSLYDMAAGDVLCWSDSLCSRMARGEGPRVAPRVDEVPAYREAPVGQAHPIGSYVGIPLTGPDGELFGTLCGMAPEPSPTSLAAAQPLLELQCRLLSSLLAVELRAIREQRRAALMRLPGAGRVLDPDRWEVLLRGEQERCAPHATPASVIALEIDAVPGRSIDGDLRAQQLLVDRSRAGDALARTGPRSYALLCTETAEAVAQTVATDLVLRLQDAGVVASCGVAAMDLRVGDLPGAWRRAQQRWRAETGDPRTPLALACA